MKSITINFDPYWPPRKPHKKAPAFVLILALCVLTKDLSHLLKQLVHLFHITLGIFARSNDSQLPCYDQYLTNAREDLYRLEARAVQENDPIERQRLLSIVNGMIISA